MPFGAVVGFLLAGVAAGTAHAQAPADFGALEPGQVVRVRTIGRSLFETRLGGTAGDSLPALFAAATIPFEAGRVDSLWVRGRAVVTGAIVGTAVITPLAFLSWWSVCDAVAEGTGCDDWATVGLLTFATGVGGALIGAGVGVLLPKWRLRYARSGTVSVGPYLRPRQLGLSVGF